MSAATDRYLNVDQLAELLGLSTNWIYERTAAREIPHSRFGKHVRFSPDDVAAIRDMHREPVGGAR